MNASPTERTFGAGRLEDLAAGKAWGSETNLLCKVSRSAMNCLRTSRAASWLGAAPFCALSIEGHAATSSPIAASASRLFIGSPGRDAREKDGIVGVQRERHVTIGDSPGT